MPVAVLAPTSGTATGFITVDIPDDRPGFRQLGILGLILGPHWL